MSKESTYFSKAKVKLILDHPFFAVLALHLIEKEMDMGNPIIQQLVMPTVGVDGQNLYVNPEFVKGIPDDQMIGLLAHEVMHVALGHVWSWHRQWRDPKKWNWAGDYVINKNLRDEGMKLPEGGLYDAKYDDMSSEEIYSLLEEEEKKDGKGQGKGSGGKGSWEDLLPSLGAPSDGEGEGDGSGGKPKGLSPHEMQELEQEWKERLVEAVYVAKMKGKLPAGLERLVDDIVAPSVPWYSLFDQFVNEIIRDDYNEMIHDRRFIQQGIYLPDMYSEGCWVAIAIDTSGSIGREELKLFLSETVGILRSRNVKHVKIMACDAELTMSETVYPWDDIPDNFPGGGGTDFRPVFDHLDEDMDKPACLVYLTDCYGTFPESAPRYPVLWCTMTEDYDIPFGTKITFDPAQCGVEIEHMG